MLKGKKVLLRPMKKEDIPRQHEFDQDIETHILNGGPPRSSPLERTQALYETCTKQDTSVDCFAIEADGKYIGHCSLRHSLNYPGLHTLGINIGDRDYWGRGYGRDAILLLLDFGFHYFGARRIGLITNAKNERAIKCFNACGFVEEGRTRKAKWIDGEYTDLVKMGILREEWEATESNRQSSVE